MRWLAALLLCLIPGAALAQNPTCPTRPAGDSTNACSSTAFVQAAFTALAVGGCTVNTPPTQTTPVSSVVGVCGSYADSTAGNIFQVSSWADNSGTRPTVAVFGQGRATGVSGRVWGANFVAYANANNAIAQGIEVDVGHANGITGSSVIGLAVNAAGTSGANQINGMNFDSLGAGSTFRNAILFNNNGLAQPYTVALIATGNVGGALTTPVGIDFNNATFGTAAFRSPGFSIDGSGNLTANNVTTAWTAFTPSPSCGTATFTTNSARSKTIGKTTFVEVDISFTALGTCTNGQGPNFSFTLPNVPNTTTVVTGREVVNNSGMTSCTFASGTSAVSSCVKQVAALVNWTGTDRMIVSGVYENQ
jgi:hypothetical protein